MGNGRANELALSRRHLRMRYLLVQRISHRIHLGHPKWSPHACSQLILWHRCPFVVFLRLVKTFWYAAVLTLLPRFRYQNELKLPLPQTPTEGTNDIIDRIYRISISGTTNQRSICSTTGYSLNFSSLFSANLKCLPLFRWQNVFFFSLGRFLLIRWD